MMKHIRFWLVLMSGLHILPAMAQENSISIGNNTNYNGFPMLNGAIEKNRIIISGENGDFSTFTSRFEYKFLRFLNDEHGIRNYVMEVGPAKAGLINKYISTGDSSIEVLLKSVSSSKYMRLYKNVKKLNEKLPDSLKIRVFGVDIEKYSALPIVQISQILPSNHIPEKIRIGVEALHGAAKYVIKKGLEEYSNEKEITDDDDNFFYNPTSFSVFKSAQEFLKYYDSLSHEFETWLGADFPKFEEAISWLKENKDWREHSYSAFQYSMREDNIFINFKKVLDAHPGEKFFAQLNRCRISKKKLFGDCGYYDYSGLVNRFLSLDNPDYSIYNIGIFHNSPMDLNAEKSTNAMLMKKEVDKLLEAATTETAAFTDLHSPKVSYPALLSNYDAVMIDKDYPVRDFNDETDLLPYPIGKRVFENEEEKPALMPMLAANYIYSAHAFNKRAEFNNAVKNEGLPTVEPRYYAGVEGVVYPGDGSYFGFSYSWTTSSSRNFTSARYLSNIGSNVLNKKHIKVGGGLQMGYIRHNFSKAGIQGSDTSIQQYKAPTIISNPAFVTGINYQMQLSLWYFSIYINGGYMIDFSDKRWILNGNYVSESGIFSSSGLYISGGVGATIPLSNRSKSSLNNTTR